MAITNKTIKNLDELPAMMKVQNVQEVLEISKVTAYELVNSSGFPLLKIGKRLIVPKEAFIRWIEENTSKYTLSCEKGVKV